jgi:hypothetical protein
MSAMASGARDGLSPASYNDSIRAKTFKAVARRATGVAPVAHDGRHKGVCSSPVDPPQSHANLNRVRPSGA